MLNLLESALAFAGLGYRALACQPGKKIPLTKHGCLDATTDIDQLERWWNQAPYANLAIATDGLLVVDVDAESDWLRGEPERQLELACAPMSLTANGGRHYFFRQPQDVDYRCTVGKIAPHVDTRANGGYVVLPPSILGGKNRYRWGDGMGLEEPRDRLPQPPSWLADLLLASPSSATAMNVDGNPIPRGQRNATLASLAGSMRRVGMTQAEILAALLRVNQDRCAPPLKNEEVDRIAASIGRYEADSVAVALAENHYEQIFGEKSGLEVEDPGDFPEHLLQVPGMITDLIDHNLQTAFRPQPVLALGAAIALMGTLTGRKVRDENNTRTNVYCLGVCPSGGGKERARQLNKELLFLANGEAMIGPEGLASHAGLISAIERQPAILFQLDEIGRLLRTVIEPHRSPHLYHIATNLMKLFTSSGGIYLGDAYADPDRNKVIHQPHACVWGTTVPQSLYEGLSAESITDGFLSRVMIFEAPTQLVPRQRPQQCAVPSDIVEFARHWVKLSVGGNLSEQHPQPILVRTTAAARRCWEQLDEVAEQERERLGEPLGSLWTRVTEKATKLGLIYACSRDRKDWRIDKQAASWACELSTYLTRRLIYLASQWVAENPFDARRKRVLRLITDAGEQGLTGSQLYRKTRHLTKRERSEILETLLLCGDVIENKEATGGPPRARYLAARFCR